MGREGAIINSRRYTNAKIERVSITEIIKLNEDLTPIVIKLNEIIGEIQELYPAFPTRPLNDNV